MVISFQRTRTLSYFIVYSPTFCCHQQASSTLEVVLCAKITGARTVQIIQRFALQTRQYFLFRSISLFVGTIQIQWRDILSAFNFHYIVCSSKLSNKRGPYGIIEERRTASFFLLFRPYSPFAFETLSYVSSQTMALCVAFSLQSMPFTRVLFSPFVSGVSSQTITLFIGYQNFSSVSRVEGQFTIVAAES